MILREQIWFSVSKFIEQIFARNKFAHCEQISWATFFYEQFSWAVSNFFADVSSKIIDRAGRSSFEPARHWTRNGFASGRRVSSIIHDCHVLPDLPGCASPRDEIMSKQACTSYVDVHETYLRNLTKWIFYHYKYLVPGTWGVLAVSTRSGLLWTMILWCYTANWNKTLHKTRYIRSHGTRLLHVHMA